jgi:hypothetical protein
MSRMMEMDQVRPRIVFIRDICGFPERSLPRTWMDPKG